MFLLCIGAYKHVISYDLDVFHIAEGFVRLDFGEPLMLSRYLFI